MCGESDPIEEEPTYPWRFTIPLPGHNAFETWSYDQFVDTYYSALSAINSDPESSFLRIGDLKNHRDLREFVSLFVPRADTRESPQWPPWDKNVDFKSFAPVARPLLDTPETSVQIGRLLLPTSSSFRTVEGEDLDSDTVRVRVSASVLSEHADERRKIFEALLRLRCPRAASRFSQCCGSGSVLMRRSVTGQDSYTCALNRCRSRWCPHCARIRASRIAARLGPIVNAMRAPKMITLTLRQDDTERLTDTIKRLHANWRKLLRRRLWRDNVSGGVSILECKRGAVGWNCHYHVLAEAKYLPWRSLSEEWESVTGDSPIVDIRRISRDDLARYVCKYVAKPMSNAPDDKICEVIHALHGRRMLNKFGYLSVYPGLSEDSLDEDPPQTDVVFVCSWGALVAKAQAKQPEALRILATLLSRVDPSSRDGTPRGIQLDLFSGG